jgi:hypothetical protein
VSSSPPRAMVLGLMFTEVERRGTSRVRDRLGADHSSSLLSFHNRLPVPVSIKQLVMARDGIDLVLNRVEQV